MRPKDELATTTSNSVYRQLHKRDRKVWLNYNTEAGKAFCEALEASDEVYPALRAKAMEALGRELDRRREDEFDWGGLDPNKAGKPVIHTPDGSFVVEDDDGETAEIEADPEFRARLEKSIQQAKDGKTKTTNEVRQALQLPKGAAIKRPGPLPARVPLKGEGPFASQVLSEMREEREPTGAGHTHTIEDVCPVLKSPQGTHKTDEEIREGIKERMRAKHGRKK